MLRKCLILDVGSLCLNNFFNSLSAASRQILKLGHCWGFSLSFGTNALLCVRPSHNQPTESTKCVWIVGEIPIKGVVDPLRCMWADTLKVCTIKAGALFATGFLNWANQQASLCCVRPFSSSFLDVVAQDMASLKHMGHQTVLTLLHLITSSLAVAASCLSQANAVSGITPVSWRLAEREMLCVSMVVIMTSRSSIWYLLP